MDKKKLFTVLNEFCFASGRSSKVFKTRLGFALWANNQQDTLQPQHVLKNRTSENEFMNDQLFRY